MDKEKKDDIKNKSSIEYPKVTGFDVIKQYFGVAKKYWFTGVLSILGGVLSVILMQIVTPIYLKKFFDLISDNKIILEGTVSNLLSIIIAILFVNIVAWVGGRASQFALAYFEAQVIKDLAEKAFNYLLGHSYNFFINNFAGSLVQRVNRFSRSFIRIADRILMDITAIVVKLFGSIIVLYIYKPELAFIVLVWAVVYLTASFIFSKIKLKYDIQGAAIDSKVVAAVSDSVSNHNSVQLFNGYKNETKIFGEIWQKFKELTLLRWNLGNSIDAVQSLLAIAIQFAIFYFGVKYWSLGLITLGTFVLVQAYVLSIQDSLSSVSRIVRDIYEATADAKEMVEILYLEYNVKDIKNPKTLHVHSGEIDFKDVTFYFGKDKVLNKKIFDNLNLHIKAGEKVAVIGSSGAGKSTLVKLLLRLYDTVSGGIYIDGQDIKQVSQHSLRQNISLVPQDTLLFHRTIMENIRYGRQDASDLDVIEAAKKAHCHEFILGLPYQYDTYVGERGVKLSGGERQRVAIARAVLKNSPVLILDEATSSLDSHSEAMIQDALEKLMKDRTSIVIAHRLSTIRNMDRIVVIDNGKVIEDGSHDALLKNDGGIYKKLWNLQAGGFGSLSIEEMLENK